MGSFSQPTLTQAPEAPASLRFDVAVAPRLRRSDSVKPKFGDKFVDLGAGLAG